MILPEAQKPHSTKKDREKYRRFAEGIEQQMREAPDLSSFNYEDIRLPKVISQFPYVQERFFARLDRFREKLLSERGTGCASAPTVCERMPDL